MKKFKNIKGYLQAITALSEYKVAEDERTKTSLQAIKALCTEAAGRKNRTLRFSWAAVGLNQHFESPEGRARNRAISGYIVAELKKEGLRVIDSYDDSEGRDCFISWE